MELWDYGNPPCHPQMPSTILPAANSAICHLNCHKPALTTPLTCGWTPPQPRIVILVCTVWTHCEHHNHLWTSTECNFQQAQGKESYLKGYTSQWTQQPSVCAPHQIYNSQRAPRDVCDPGHSNISNSEGNKSERWGGNEEILPLITQWMKLECTVISKRKINKNQRKINSLWSHFCMVSNSVLCCFVFVLRDHSWQC